MFEINTGTIRNLGMMDFVVAFENEYDETGIMARANYGLIENCALRGTISSPGVVAGLTGQNYGVIRNCYTDGRFMGIAVSGLVFFNANVIENCYSSAKLAGEQASFGLAATNGAIDKLSGCFWDVEQCGTKVSELGTGLKTTQMRSKFYFDDAGWRFEGDAARPGSWRMKEDRRDYPRLTWERSIPGDLAGEPGVDLIDFGALTVKWLEAYDVDDLKDLVENWMWQPEGYDADLVAWWPLDYDGWEVVNGYDGELVNGAAIVATDGWVHAEQAAKFTGPNESNDLIDCGAGREINQLADFSVSMWLSIHSLPGVGKYPHIICQRDTNEMIWGLYLSGENPGSLSGVVNAREERAVSASRFVPELDRWYQVTMTYGDTGDRKVRLYVDGDEIDYRSQSPAVGAKIADASIPVVMGNRLGGDRGFKGMLWDVRMYRRALTLEEIRKTAGYYDPIAWWPFDRDTRDIAGGTITEIIDYAQISQNPGNYEKGFGALQVGVFNGGMATCPAQVMQSLTKFSVALWFKAAALPEDQTGFLIGQRDLERHGWSLTVWGSHCNHITGYVGGSEISAVTETMYTPSVGRWNHLVMTYDGTTNGLVRVYVNGSEFVAIEQTPLEGTRLEWADLPITMGDREGGDRQFRGWIDDVRIYRRVLSETEIADLSGRRPIWLTGRSIRTAGMCREKITVCC